MPHMLHSSTNWQHKIDVIRFLCYKDAMETMPTTSEHGFNVDSLPALGNGFAFVVDRRPSGQEDSLIPSDEYTAYFAQRQVPLADTDHTGHDHDRGHVPSYIRIFAAPTAAEIIATSAQHSVGDERLCRVFTGAVDKLGDAIGNMMDCRGDIAGLPRKNKPDIMAAAAHAYTLVSIADPAQSASEHQASVATILNELEVINPLDEQTYLMPTDYDGWLKLSGDVANAEPTQRLLDEALQLAART